MARPAEQWHPIIFGAAVGTAAVVGCLIGVAGAIVDHLFTRWHEHAAAVPDAPLDGPVEPIRPWGLDLAERDW